MRKLIIIWIREVSRAFVQNVLCRVVERSP
jgi:hypothetical protein